MATPKTYKAFRRTTGDLPRTIKPSTEPYPQSISPTEVLIKIHAVSLNFRDVAMLNGRYPVEVIEKGIPTSDCAAEVVKTGSDVKSLVFGDHVAPIFNLTMIKGDEDEKAVSLGGDLDGPLSEYAVFEEKVLVKLPDNLSWEEGSLLACAGVTAWTALASSADGPKGRFVLLEGTGGVSIFALVLALASDITPIITSSSDEKIAGCQKVFGSRVLGINYKTTPDIASEVERLTEGRGVDAVVNNTGVGAIPNNIRCLRARNGVISMVGFLAGLDADWKPVELMGLMGKHAKLQGIGVGSREDFKNLNAFIETKKINLKPLIDRTFAFDDSEEAFHYLYSGAHVGKIVIKI